MGPDHMGPQVGPEDPMGPGEVLPPSYETVMGLGNHKIDSRVMPTEKKQEAPPAYHVVEMRQNFPHGYKRCNRVWTDLHNISDI